jgi:hypothetical protein
LYRRRLVRLTTSCSSAISLRTTFSEIPCCYREASREAPVAVTAVILLKDIGRSRVFPHTYRTDVCWLCGKNNSCGQVAERSNSATGYFFLRASTIRVFSLFFSVRKLMPRSFLSVHSPCQYVTFELQLMNLLPESLDFTE